MDKKIHLPMQGTRVPSLARADSTCCGATLRLEPVLRNRRSHRREKPPQGEARAQGRAAPTDRNQTRPVHGDKGPAQPASVNTDVLLKRSKRQAQSLHGGNPSPASHCAWGEAHTPAHHPRGGGYTPRPLHISSPPAPSWFPPVTLASLRASITSSSFQPQGLCTRRGCPGAHGS